MAWSLFDKLSHSWQSGCSLGDTRSSDAHDLFYLVFGGGSGVGKSRSGIEFPRILRDLKPRQYVAGDVYVASFKCAVSSFGFASADNRITLNTDRPEGVPRRLTEFDIRANRLFVIRVRRSSSEDAVAPYFVEQFKWSLELEEAGREMSCKNRIQSSDVVKELDKRSLFAYFDEDKDRPKPFAIITPKAVDLPHPFPACLIVVSGIDAMSNFFAHMLSVPAIEAELAKQPRAHDSKRRTWRRRRLETDESDEDILKPQLKKQKLDEEDDEE